MHIEKSKTKTSYFHPRPLAMHCKYIYHQRKGYKLIANTHTSPMQSSRPSSVQDAILTIRHYLCDSSISSTERMTIIAEIMVPDHMVLRSEVTSSDLDTSSDTDDDLNSLYTNETLDDYESSSSEESIDEHGVSIIPCCSPSIGLWGAPVAIFSATITVPQQTITAYDIPLPHLSDPDSNGHATLTFQVPLCKKHVNGMCCITDKFYDCGDQSIKEDHINKGMSLKKLIEKHHLKKLQLQDQWFYCSEINDYLVENMIAYDMSREKMDKESNKYPMYSLSKLQSLKNQVFRVKLMNKEQHKVSWEKERRNRILYKQIKRLKITQK